MALTTTEEAQTRALIEQNAALLSLAASEPTIISKLAATKASLSDLPAATAFNSGDLLLVRQGTEDKSVTASLVGGNSAYSSYLPSGTGAVATTVQTKLREIASVKDFIPLGFDTSTTDCAPYVQSAINASNGRIDFGSTGIYLISSPVGFPSNSVQGDRMMMMRGSGATILVNSTEAIFTSQSSIATPESTSNLYAAKLNVTGLTFKANMAGAVLFNGDRLYNLMCYRNNFYGTGLTVIKSFRDHLGVTGGYLQSVIFDGNHFAIVGQIIDANRAFNVVFVNNHCEGCIKGLYIVGTSDPALNSLRADNNLWEGGGVFLKLGAVLGYSIHGNYFESNTLGDVPTLKCFIYMVRASGGYNSGGSITCNQVQVTEAYKTDVDYRDIKFSGVTSTVNTLNVAQPIVYGNWTNSYQLITEEQVFTQFGNGTPTVGALARWLSPKLHTEARVSFAANQREFLASTHLSAGVFTVYEISTTAIKALSSMSKRPMTAELTLFMQQRTSGAVVVGACVAKVLLVVQAAEGSSPGNASTNVYVGASLISFAEIPAGSVFDTVFGSDFKKHFTTPVLSVVANGADNYYLKLSGYASPSTANYGPADRIKTYMTMEMQGNNNGLSLAGQLGS